LQSSPVDLYDNCLHTGADHRGSRAVIWQNIDDDFVAWFEGHFTSQNPLAIVDNFTALGEKLAYIF
jgi:hypothetical protein